VFCNAAGLLFLLGVEFLALVFVVVYVGAIAVLFLFCCMMLNIRSEEVKFMVFSYLPISSFLGFFALFELFQILGSFLPKIAVYTGGYVNWANSFFAVSNIHAIAAVLYSFYFFPFVVASLILLVAMIGSILLTLYHRPDVKRQSVFLQVKRDSFSILQKVTFK